jgi:putative oxidoreductase
VIAESVVRAVLGLYLVASGAQKLLPALGFGGLDGAAKAFAGLGLRGGRMAVLGAAVVQIGCGVFLATGFLTQLAGFGATVVMLVATCSVRRNGFWSQRGGVEYPLLLVVLSASFMWMGGGRFSVDHSIGLGMIAGPLAAIGVVAAIAIALVTVAVLTALPGREDVAPRATR